MGKNSQEQSSAPKGTSSIHGRTETDEGSKTNNIFRQHTLTKEGGCKRAQPRLSAILPLGGLVHAEVVVFVRQG
jgi:hypothetical protein